MSSSANSIGKTEVIVSDTYRVMFQSFLISSSKFEMAKLIMAGLRGFCCLLHIVPHPLMDEDKNIEI